jgi:methenyltetrahydrofolate cyclohydrolase
VEIEKFLESLASSTPTPGGGSASALAGSLSASLVAMVAGLSKGKGMAGIRRKALTIQKRLYLAIEEDAKSFGAVMEAFRLPKDLEKEKLRRRREIQKAYRNATITPQIVCQRAVELLQFSQTLIQKGNPNAISDAWVGAFLADSALAGGLFNISINLGPQTEKAFLRKMHSSMQQWVKKRNFLMEKIHASLPIKYHTR